MIWHVQNENFILDSTRIFAQKFVSIFPDIMHGSGISWRILQKKLCLPQWNLISEISSKCLHNLLLSEEMIHRNNESPLISTHLRSPNAREFLYSILFLLLVAGYLVRTHLLFVSRASSELQTEFEKVKQIGIHLSTDFFLPFELISIILLVALIGAIAVARQ